jgi:hypothetical protein
MTAGVAKYAVGYSTPPIDAVQSLRTRTPLDQVSDTITWNEKVTSVHLRSPAHSDTSQDLLHRLRHLRDIHHLHQS